MSVCWWAGFGLRGPRASASSLLGGARSQCLWLQGPGGPGASAGALVCGAGSYALWWAEPGSEVTMGSGSKAAGLLVGGAMFLPS